MKYPLGYLPCSEDRAREKASQALREGAAKLRKEGAWPRRAPVVRNVLLPNETAAERIYCDDPRMERYAECFEPPRNPQKRRVGRTPPRVVGVSGTGFRRVRARVASVVHKGRDAPEQVAL